MLQTKISDSYFIAGSDVWLDSGVREKQNLLVLKGILTARGGEELVCPAGVEKIAAAGLSLLPAGVDAQVHLRVPGQAQKETAASGLAASIHGGVGALLTMPNTQPVIDSEESFALAQEQLAAATAELGAKVLISAAITIGQRGRELVDFASLARCGVRAFTDDGYGVASDEVMEQAFARAESHGLPLLQHAEVPGHGGVLAAGPVQENLAVKAYPAAAEVEMVERDLRLLRKYPKARYHVLHISAAGSLKALRQAKNDGLHATGEVSPHHLLLTSEDIHGGDTSYKMNPPLRQTSDRQALQEALRSGLIDFVATDHAPHEKAIKGSDFKTAAYGTTGLETSLRVLLTLWQQGLLSPARLVEVFSTAPAKFLGLREEGFGALEVGKPFRAVLVDTRLKPEPFSANDIFGLAKNSCFVGRPLAGKILRTFLQRHIHGWDHL